MMGRFATIASLKWGNRWLWRYCGLVLAVGLSGCATTPRVVDPAVAAVHSLPHQAADGDVVFYDDDNYQILLAEGLPADFFVTTARGHGLDYVHRLLAARLRHAARNQGVVHG